MTFLPASPPLARALAERNYTEPTPVQTAVLADAAIDRDLLVSAQTGSGKTVAYGLAIAKNILGDADRFGRAGKPLALMVAPTRELAVQLQRELDWLYQYTGARVVSCVGGMDPRREQRELADGAHIVVGTPGRLCDHLRRGRLDVSELKAIVLDEADEMLDLGFREDLEFILKTTPEQRRTLLFSATLPRGIVALARQYQKNAHRIEVTGGERGHADIEYRAIRVAPQDVEHAVVNVLRFFESPSALVFCNTRNAVNRLQAALLERGFSVVALSGELSQGERTHALQALRDGRSRVCVATDVAARGIDLPNLGLVIHADLPNDAETLQHRSGRTGRAGRKGVSVMLVPPSRRRKAEIMLRQGSIDAIWGTTPQADEIRKLDQQRMLQDSLFTEAPSEDDLTLARTLLAERSPEAIAAALARMYRARLPAPEDILDPGQDRGYDRGNDRGNDRGDRPDAAPRKPRARDGMPEGSVWFRVTAGRQKKAEARWLLPMICRRGGVNKSEIGAIRIYEHHSEFEISANAAEKFATKIQRPDKEQHVIAALPNGPQGETAIEKPIEKPASHGQASNGQASNGKVFNGKARHADKPRDDKFHADKRDDLARMPQGEPSAARRPQYNKKRPFGQRHRNAPETAPAGQGARDGAAPFAKPAFVKPAFVKKPNGPKKPKKNKKQKNRNNPLQSGFRG